MIEDKFFIKDWKIKIMYECTYRDLDYIIEALEDIDCPDNLVKEATDNINTKDLNIGLTYSNLNLRSSIIMIGKTSSFSQFINTVSHEYYHLMCHLRKGFNNPKEEELANLTGNLNMHSYNFIKKIFKKQAFD